MKGHGCVATELDVFLGQADLQSAHQNSVICLTSIVLLDDLFAGF